MPHMLNHAQHARRQFLSQTASGFGLMAMSDLLGNKLQAGEKQHVLGSGILEGTHALPKAKRVIYLFQSGGPSHLDLFDYKPLLKDLHGQDMPPSVLGAQRVTLMTRDKGRRTCASPFKFAQHGSSGAWLTELLPHTAKVVDDLCFIKSLQTEPINHDPAVTFIQTGRAISGRPAFGSWMHYGLGNASQNLPAYVVMICGNADQPILSRYYHSGFLPSRFQGVQFQSTGDPVLFLSNPSGIDHRNRGRIINTINQLNSLQYAANGDPEIEARIDSFEMAYQMQTSVPELMDYSTEPKGVLEMYGPDVTTPGTYAYQCLMARRLAERDVRFVQIFHTGWDHHGGLRENMTRQTQASDQASAALITDLKMRGMLDDTLVVWGGEFGRTAYSQGDDLNGRDHHPRCFSIWMAGGGIKPGLTLGATDDYGYNITDNVIHVRDLHATMLQLLGIDHQQFTFRNQGLDDRLTGVEPARIIHEILA
ncbi:MAG: DUF1501 domain-containing protein [Planctomycetales bacterium]|nr:DUF1501 domain-containing protein [Planctomycetales bacterium]